MFGGVFSDTLVYGRVLCDVIQGERWGGGEGGRERDVVMGTEVSRYDERGMLTQEQTYLDMTREVC